MQIITEYPLWFSFFCILLGALYSFFLYRKNKRLAEFSSWLIIFLAALRFILVTVLSFLLLSPLMQNLNRKVEEPIVIIAQDNSSSILMNKDSAYYAGAYKQQLNNLSEELESDFDVSNYTFGETFNNGIGSVDFKERVTDISALLKEIEDRFANRNVGALILASDGIYNKGFNPSYQTDVFSFPIYTIALGDTTIYKDVFINDIHLNQIAYLGNKFPVVVDVTALKAENNRFKITIEKNGKTVYSEQISSNSENFSTSISATLTAEAKGLQKYSVRLSPLKGEINTKNNVQDFYIDVLDGRQRILLLANSPHPDVKAIKRSIESNDNYEVSVDLVNNFRGEPADFDLVILHQLPNNQHRVQNIINNEELNVLYILGMQAQIPLFNTANTGLNISSNKNSLNEVQAKLKNEFPLFKLSEDFGSTLSKFPPIYSPYGNYVLSGQNYVLLTQKIGLVETENPLFFFHHDENRKIAVITGEGLWKWKLSNYAINKTTSVFDELITKSVQYLALKTDQSFFRLSSKNEFLENENITFEAELYNSSYELINEPEVEMNIVDEEGNTFPYAFSRVSNAYSLNTGTLPVGEYAYEAKVNTGEKILTETGEFSVKPIQLEQNNTIANHQLLYQIAQNSGGEMLFPQQMDEINKMLNAREDLTAISYSEMEVREIIHLKWIFYLLLFLLTLEWFLRKRNGAY